MLRGLPQIVYGMTWSILGAFWFHGAMLAPFESWWRIVPLLSLPFILAGFSFFFYPIRLGARARRTWYIVTNRRVFIAELRQGQSPQLRVFSTAEMAAPQVVKRFDGLDDVILTRRAQENPHLKPDLYAGFFGLENGEQAAGAIEAALNP
jgi:hypothetical protein